MSEDKLGYTFYAKDWWSSDTFFDLEFKERYIYLECLSLMYNGKGYMNQTKQQLEKRLRMSISDEEFEIVFSRFVKDANGYTSPTVNKRLTRAVASQKNGSKGGRPTKEKPLETKIETGNPTKELPLENNLENLENNLEKPTLLKEKKRIEIKDNDEVKNETTSTSDLIKNLKSQVNHAKGIGTDNFLTISECRNLYDSNYQNQKVGICSNPHWTFEQLKFFQDEFDLHISKTLTHKVISDYAKHFANWIAKLSPEQKQSTLQKQFIPKHQKSIEETYG